MLKAKTISALVVAGLMLSLGYWSSGAVADTFTFGTEDIITGYSDNPTNRNLEDAAYNSLVEEDSYADSNFSATAYTRPIGAGPTGTLADTYTDDSTSMGFTEQDTSLADGTLEIDPDADISSPSPVYPTTTTTMYDHLNDDYTGTYCYLEVANQNINYIVSVEGTGSTAPGDIDVQLQIRGLKDASQPANLQSGLYYSSTAYSGVNVNPATVSTWYTYNWQSCPWTADEWTLSDLNSTQLFFKSSDASPRVVIYELQLMIWVNYSETHQLITTFTFGSLADTTQTTGYSLTLTYELELDTEPFDLFVYDFSASEYDLLDSLDSLTETTETYSLTLDQHDDTNDLVLIKFEDTILEETTQSQILFDQLKVRRVEAGYSFEGSISCTTAPAYGNITLQLKGYTSAETFNVNVFNFTSDDYDLAKIVVTDLTNTWQTEMDLCDSHHRDGQTVTVQIVDTVAATGDTTQDTLYIDVLWIARYYSDPEISAFGAVPETQFYGDPVLFFCTVTDYDNDEMSYVRVYLNTSYYEMTENSTGDVSTHDGKAWYLSKSDIPVGWYNYYFAVKDANSAEITTASDILTIEAVIEENSPPEFTSGTPSTPWHNNTAYYYDANAEDPDLDTLTYGLEGSADTYLDINTASGVVTGTFTLIGDYWLNLTVSDGIAATVYLNTSIHVFSDHPYIDTSPATSWQHGTLYTYAAHAVDNETEPLFWEISGNSTSWLDITPAGAYCTVSGTVPSEYGYWDVNLTVNDYAGGLGYQNWTITSLNTAPVFTSSPDYSAYVNDSYSYTPTASDLNGDTVTFDISTSPLSTLENFTFNVTSGAIEGNCSLPGEYLVNLSASDGFGGITWSNYTITVSVPTVVGDTPVILAFILSLIFGVSVPVVGFVWDLPHYELFGGLVWIFSAFSIYHNLNIGLMLFGMALGIILLLKGANDLDKT